MPPRLPELAHIHSSHDRIRSLPVRTWLALLLTVFAACIVRLWLVPLPSSFWVDELVTAFVVAHPNHPSLTVAPQVPASIYYWMPWIMDRLFGLSISLIACHRS